MKPVRRDSWPCSFSPSPLIMRSIMGFIIFAMSDDPDDAGADMPPPAGMPAP